MFCFLSRLRYFLIIAGILLLPSAATTTTHASIAYGSIRGLVFNDKNGNGIANPGESGLANVPIIVTVADTIFEIRSGDDGTFAPATLTSGIYQVSITPPTGCRATSAASRQINLELSSVVLGVNFGLQCGNTGAPSPPASPPTNNQAGNNPPFFNFNFNCGTAIGLPRGECQALVNFFRQTGGPRWLEKGGWLNWPEACIWHGITCEGGHVVALELPHNAVGGSLPNSLGDLRFLRRLILSDNFINGHIPKQIGYIPHLTWLFLDNNQLTGSIPVELATPINLSFINLSHNRLNAGIPPELGNLFNLQWLLLEDNQLRSAIPPELGRLPWLSSIDLSHNQLYGPIPREFVGLGSLTRLDVRQNPLIGSIPGELTTLSNLRAFYYDHTSLCAPNNAGFTIWLNQFSSQNLTRSGFVCGVNAPGWN